MKSLDERNQIRLDRIIDTDMSHYPHSKDLTGEVFDKLTVVERIGHGYDHRNYYWCKCKCENMVVRNDSELRKGRKCSCGCDAEKAYRMAGKRISKSRTTHGLSSTKLYKIWKSMRARCNRPTDKAYYQYGGRGIKVCPEWNNLKDGFINFYNWAHANGYSDYYETHNDKYISIDRIDVDGNYCPENCRWVNNYVQSNNRTSNIYFQLDRYVFTLTIWSRILNINRATMHDRLNELKWSLKDSVLTIPNKPCGTYPTTIEIPSEYDIYNKYDEWVRKGKIKPVEETIYKDCPYIAHK